MNWNFRTMLTVLCVLALSFTSAQSQETGVDYSKMIAGSGGTVNSINKPTIYVYVHAGDTITVRHFSTTKPFCAVMYFGETDNALAYGSENLSVTVDKEGVLSVGCIKNTKSLLGHAYLIGVFSE